MSLQDKDAFDRTFNMKVTIRITVQDVSRNIKGAAPQCDCRLDLNDVSHDHSIHTAVSRCADQRRTIKWRRGKVSIKHTDVCELHTLSSTEHEERATCAARLSCVCVDLKPGVNTHEYRRQHVTTVGVLAWGNVQLQRHSEQTCNK